MSDCRFTLLFIEDIPFAYRIVTEYDPHLEICDLLLWTFREIVSLASLVHPSTHFIYHARIR